jgi:hypothetical protein
MYLVTQWQRDRMDDIVEKRKQAAISEIKAVITYWNEEPTEERRVWECEPSSSLAKRSEFVLATYGSTLRSDARGTVTIRVRRDTFELAMALEGRASIDVLFRLKEDAIAQLLDFYEAHRIRETVLDQKLALHVKEATWADTNHPDFYLSDTVPWALDASQAYPDVLPTTGSMCFRRLQKRLDPYQYPFSMILLTEKQAKQLQKYFSSGKLPLPSDLMDCDTSGELFPKLYVRVMAECFQSRTVMALEVVFGKGDRDLEGTYHREPGNNVNPCFTRRERWRWQDVDYPLYIAKLGKDRNWTLAYHDGIAACPLQEARSSKHLVAPPSSGWIPVRSRTEDPEMGYCSMKIRSVTYSNHSNHDFALPSARIRPW